MVIAQHLDMLVKELSHVDHVRAKRLVEDIFADPMKCPNMSVVLDRVSLCFTSPLLPATA